MIISNAQISTHGLCEKAHDLRYNLNKEPKRLAPALYRGVQGHSALQSYYCIIKDGGTVDEALKAAHGYLDNEIARISKEEPHEFARIQDIFKLRELIEAYSWTYREEPFKVHSVEEAYSCPVDEEIEYILRIDLLVEMTKGEYRGDFIVVDHKFVYNFKTVLDIAMDAQLPKYVKALRENGYIISKGMFNQLRTRDLTVPTAKDLFRRDIVKTNTKEVQRIWDEQAYTARKIRYNRSDSNYIPVRTLNYQVCRYCAYQGPCKAELDGSDITQYLETNFTDVKSPLRQKDMSDIQ